MVVQGRLQRKGPALHLTVVLIDSKRLRQIGSVELEDRPGNLAALQTQAVSQLARMMKVRVPEAAHASAGNITSGTYEAYRSEERRVGKECRSRWSPDH